MKVIDLDQAKLDPASVFGAPKDVLVAPDLVRCPTTRRKDASQIGSTKILRVSVDGAGVAMFSPVHRLPQTSDRDAPASRLEAQLRLRHGLKGAVSELRGRLVT